MEKIQVFLVDKNELFRQGVRVALSGREDIEVVGESDSDKNALSHLESLQVNIVLLDINLPSLSGLDLARQIMQRSPNISVIILTPYEDEEHLFQAIEAGAAAYLTKEISTERLACVIRKVFRGEQVISESLLARPKVAERVLKQFRDLSFKRGRRAFLPITPREAEILSYVARGYGNKQIAQILHNSQQTIKNHITSILRKLEANDRTHAVVLAMRNGWISADEL
jgi:DNA-binding NarL/FixJ family response regulator